MNRKRILMGSQEAGEGDDIGVDGLLAHGRSAVPVLVLVGHYACSQL